MNEVILSGRVTKDAEIRKTETTTVARYTLAVDRGYRRNGEQATDFIPCVAFGKTAEFCEKYVKKGIKLNVVGSIRVDSYQDKNGDRKWSTSVVANSHEFCERKGAETQVEREPYTAPESEFAQIPDGIDEELPFN